MGKISYRFVYNRRKILNAQGEALVQVEAYLEQKKVYFSTHIYVMPYQWDNRKKMIRCHPLADALNYKLREFIIKLETKELELWRSGHDVTLSMLKKETRSEVGKSFLHFVKEDIASSSFKDSTKRNRMSTFYVLSQFTPKLDFKEVTPQFVYSFERFLYDNGCKVNTVAKHMKHLKSFVNSAINQGYIDVNEYAFRRYKIKKGESRHAFLLPEEIEQLEKLDLQGKNLPLRRSLDAFLFCCYTGLRYSDFVNMKEKNVVKIEGSPWLIFRSVKTNIEVKLPLDLLFEGKAWEMLQKYRQNLNLFFALKSNSSVNKDLIRLGQLAGIEKHFSFHSARHTNATLLIYKGANITTVQKLLGHRNISTTQIYSDVMSSTIVRDLEKCT